MSLPPFFWGGGSKCVTKTRGIRVSQTITNLLSIFTNSFCKFSASWPLSSKKKTITMTIYVNPWWPLHCFGTATRPKICKKSVCFYCITTSLWRTPVNHYQYLDFYCRQIKVPDSALFIFAFIQIYLFTRKKCLVK